MTTDRWGKVNYLNKEVSDAFALENALFTKTHEYKGKQGEGNGKWVVKKKANKDDLKKYLRTKKNNAQYYY
jgi:hypothetical protein